MSSSGDAKMSAPPAPPPTDEFKKPPALLTVGKVGGKKKFRAPEPPPKKSSSIATAENIRLSLESRERKNETATTAAAAAPSVEKPTKPVHRKGSGRRGGKILYPAQKCPYDEPPWGGQPEFEYRLSVLKSGTIVGSEKLSKSFFVVGRHQDCDLVMEHPSISRFHAVLQYRKPHPDATDPEKQLGGFYLFDLGSTHGTQLNRRPVDAKCYRRVRVGHHIKFGFSSRAYLLEGPAEDEEAESELSVTEIIELRKKRETEWKQMLEAEKAAKAEAARKKDEEDRNTGINWGLAEDAVEDEDEENPSSEVNPFAFDRAGQANEQLYLEDPKKTLRGWFEREGYELEYHVEEKGQQQFLCRIELPIDTGSGSAVIAEACVKGRKKEAVVQCALEACRILDRHGELRKAHHESRAKKKMKNWKEDDYYDSDEDEFLDRTGDLVNKREQRKARLENKGQQIETYDSLRQKLAVTEDAIREINDALEKSKAVEAANKASGDTDDSLESFMKQLKAGTALDKAKRSQLRLEQARLTAERLRLIRLVNIAKPAELPPLKPAPSSSGLSLKGGERDTEKSLGPMVGSMRGKKRPVLPLTGMPAKVMRMQMENQKGDDASSSTQTVNSGGLREDPDQADVVEEEDDEEEDEEQKNDHEIDEKNADDDGYESPERNDQSEATTTKKQTTVSNNKGPSSSSSSSTSTEAQTFTNRDQKMEGKVEAKPTEMKEHELVKFQQLNPTNRRKTIGPTLPPGMLKSLLTKTSEDEVGSGSGKQKASSSKTSKSQRIQPTLNAAMAEKIRESDVTAAGGEDFEDWVPPAGQTGDGKTRLNEKFGY